MDHWIGIDSGRRSASNICFVENGVVIKSVWAGGGGGGGGVICNYSLSGLSCAIVLLQYVRLLYSIPGPVVLAKWDIKLGIRMEQKRRDDRSLYVVDVYLLVSAELHLVWFYSMLVSDRIPRLRAAKVIYYLQRSADIHLETSHQWHRLPSTVKLVSTINIAIEPERTTLFLFHRNKFRFFFKVAEFKTVTSA